MTCVPSKALRFTPTQEMLGKQYRIQDISNAKNKVWTLEGNVLKAHSVSIGMSDGTHTQILKGVAKGTSVITELKVTKGEDEEEEADEAASNKSPFAPGPRNKKK